MLSHKPGVLSLLGRISPELKYSSFLIAPEGKIKGYGGRQIPVTNSVPFAQTFIQLVLLSVYAPPYPQITLNVYGRKSGSKLGSDKTLYNI